MKTFHLRTAVSVAAILFAAVCASPANARCVSKPSQLRTARPAAFSLPKLPAQPAALTDPAVPAAEASIAGYWYVRFLVEGELVDDGFDLWLSDGVEVLNDAVAPSSGNVCLGVWTKTGPNTYTLKHPSWIFDEMGVRLVGIVMIRETITLDPSGNSFKGDSTFDVYDLQGNQLDHGSSTLTGERVSAVDDPAVKWGIPGLPASILRH